MKNDKLEYHFLITPDEVTNLSIELIAANITKRGTTRHHKPPNRNTCHSEVVISKRKKN